MSIVHSTVHKINMYEYLPRSAESNLITWGTERGETLAKGVLYKDPDT